MPEPTTTSEPSSQTRHRGRLFVLGLALVLALVDLLLAGVPAAPVDIDGAPAVRAYLAGLERPNDQQETWLLLGDSVLVGNTGADELPDWDTRRLIDYLERERAVAEGTRVRFAQLAYSGLLPVDMLALVEELDLRDPEGELSLLVELSPRFFSRAYAEQAEHSQPWFAEIGEREPGVASMVDPLLDWIRAYTPVYRHRAHFGAAREQLERTPEQTKDPRTAGERLEALARLRVHYSDPQFDPSSLQVAALEQLVARCRARGRRLALFATPIEDAFLAAQQTERQQGAYLAALDRLIAPDGEQVRLLPMDHPIFASELFLDHVHLRPEGHRLLAINLLHQLGVGLERLPDPRDLIAGEGVDASLVARLDRSFSDGAAWQALFDQPRDLALSPDGTRLIVVDRNNHVLRELHGDMRVVSTLAGTPGRAGDTDGELAHARFSRPLSAAFVGEQLYVADADGARLRRIADGQVQTLTRTGGDRRILQLRAHGDQLHAVESGPLTQQLVRIELETGASTPLVTGGIEPEQTPVAFAFDTHGRLYFASASGQLWRRAAGEQRVVDLVREANAPGPGLELLFANASGTVLPQTRGEYFPLSFDRMRLTQVQELIWVERYQSLLVQDIAPHPERAGKRLTERVHLRLFDFEAGQIHPWLKPLVAGVGQFHYNEDTQGFSSYFHEGAVALDPRTAVLYQLERARSRLLRIDDGVLGTAKTSEVPHKRLGFSSPLSYKGGQRAFERFRPQQFFTRRAQPLARKGPYTCLIVSSSLFVMSEAIGKYSLARRLGQHLRFDLGVRERMELQVFQRMAVGGPLAKQIRLVEQFIEGGGSADLVIFETNSSRFLDNDTQQSDVLAQLDQMLTYVELLGAVPILVDSSPYMIRHRDGPRAVPSHIRRFFELARARGVIVVEVGDQMLDESLEVTPFGTPPMSGTHLTPWAIDAIAGQLATTLSPTVRGRLRGREPAYFRPPVELIGEVPARALLDGVFAEVAYDWNSDGAQIPLRALQTNFEGGVLHVFIDLGLLGDNLDSDDLDALVLSSLYELTVRQRFGAAKAMVRIGRFANYDEYGEGVADGVKVVDERTLNREALRSLAQRFAMR